MNLILRTTILFVVISLVVFLLGGLISFNIMMREVNYEQQRFLIERLDRIKTMLDRRPPSDTLDRSKLLVIPLAEVEQDRLEFSDTLVLHSQLERIEPHLKLEAVATINGVSYAVTLYDVIIEEDDIKDGLVESLVKLYLILIGAVLIVAFAASYYLLRPFNQTLVEIKQFSLTDPKSRAIFPKSGIREIKRLNQFLDEMTSKVRSDYQMLKEFSENASHEIQTPIAIVQGKLEVLIESTGLKEEQVKQISSAQSALKRLSNLSTSLSVLNKIDNYEFTNSSSIDLSQKLGNLLEEFKELIDMKSIKIDIKIEERVMIEADEVLMELLLTNLINNAVRHNWENGSISISLQDGTLTIQNSGFDLDFDPKELFTRFKKSNQSSSSLGLGLAIVKKICDFYAFKVTYTQKNEQHQINVVTNPD